MCLFDESNPSTIPTHSSPISTLIQSLKKIDLKMLKIEGGKEAVLDRQIDIQHKFLNRWYNIIPYTF